MTKEQRLELNRRAQHAPASLIGTDPLADFRLPGEPDSEAALRKSAFDRAMNAGRIRLLAK